MPELTIQPTCHKNFPSMFTHIRQTVDGRSAHSSFHLHVSVEVQRRMWKDAYCRYLVFMETKGQNKNKIKNSLDEF